MVNTIKTRLKIADPALAEEGYQDVLKSLEKNSTPALDGMRNMHQSIAYAKSEYGQGETRAIDRRPNHAKAG